MVAGEAIRVKQGVCKRYLGDTEKYRLFINMPHFLKTKQLPSFNLREAVLIGTNRFYLSIESIIMIYCLSTSICLANADFIQFFNILISPWY